MTTPANNAFHFHYHETRQHNLDNSIKLGQTFPQQTPFSLMSMPQNILCLLMTLGTPGYSPDITHPGHSALHMTYV